MIDSAFWKKKHDWQRILGKQVLIEANSAKNTIGSTFWEKQ
jgi:hypothetical protein